MKIRILPVICLVGFVLSISAEAKKKKSDSTPDTPAPANAATEEPSARIAQLLKADLEGVLAPLDGKGLKDAQAILDTRESLADQAAKAPPLKRAAYVTAEDVCDALIAAFNERKQSITSLTGSTAVKADSQLGAIRKDRTGPFEEEREAREQKQRNKDAKNTDNFFTAGQKEQWLKRADLHRQRIEQLYSRQRETERQANAAAADAAAAAAAAPRPPATAPTAPPGKPQP